jgi:hypothetical protein
LTVAYCPTALVDHVPGGGEEFSMSEFRIGTLTYSHRATDGRVVTCTVPVDWPPALLLGDESFRFEAEGYRAGDRRPAALYGSDAGSWLWYCDGEAFDADGPGAVANNEIH